LSDATTSAQSWWHRYRGEVLMLTDRLGPLLSFAIVTTFFSLTATNFLTHHNALNIGVQAAVYGILAIGETFVIIAAGIDLSVGAATALCGVVAAVVMRGEHGAVAGIAAGLATGAGVGLVNGLISAYGNMPSFIVTLGTMLTCRGIALWVSKGVNVTGLPETFGKVMGGTFYPGQPYEVRVPIVIMIVAALAFHLVLSRTRLGRYTYAIGSNEEATRLSGVDVRRYKASIFVLSGVLAGLAGLVQATRISGGSPTTAEWYELSAIAAAVIGGTSLMGGEGTIGRTIVGALLIGVVANGLDLRNADPYWQKIATGSIIVFAVFLDRLRRQRRA
jgi:ribose transport system permease protein